MVKTDTIAAIATSVGNGGISIIRISGDEALSIIDQIYKSKNGQKILSKEASHTLHYGYIYNKDELIDEVMVAIMKNPSTYTREDIVEIDCHGGIVVTQRILEAVLEAGARLAEPGEFTKRAFLNGRIDLSQAEAISDIISAKNEMALKNSLNQLKGNMLELIKSLREIILRDIAFIEAALDDPEHISLDGFDLTVLEHLDYEYDKINHLVNKSRNGKIIKEGIKTVIVGKPNAGKSSLLNHFLGEDRAIVTDIAGTTRDTLEEVINLNGITLNIIDTAGIRETGDVVEKMGVDKAKKFLQEADFIIYVVDSSLPLDDNDYDIMKMIEDKKAVILLNKSDLKKVVTEEVIQKSSKHPMIPFSVKEDRGMETLVEHIKTLFFQGKLDFNEEIYITNERHREAFLEALESIRLVRQSVEAGMPEDFYSIDLMSAYETLGRIIGENVEEDLVNMIFREFCMGK